MAMQITLNAPDGLPCTYHRITSLTQNNGQNTTTAVVASYKDRDTRMADVTAWAGDPRVETLPGYLTIPQAYAWLESTSPVNNADFAGAQDV